MHFFYFNEYNMLNEQTFCFIKSWTIRIYGILCFAVLLK